MVSYSMEKNAISEYRAYHDWNLYLWPEITKNYYRNNNIHVTICSKQVTYSFFNSSLPTMIKVDASGTGIGYYYKINIRYHSHRELWVQQRYAIIKRELLAVIYGCERFHHYIYGSSFKVKRDHKLLSMIILK